MLFSESLYFLILFTLPAALHIVYHAYIRQVPRVSRDKSVELAECIIFSLVVFFINILIMNKDMFLFAGYLLSNDQSGFYSQTGFDYLHFMIKYFIVNMGVSIGAITVWYLVLIKVFRGTINRVNRATGKPQEFPFNDVWRNIFETNKIVEVKNCAVRIEKSGQLVSAGLLRAFPAPHVDTREIALYNTDFVKELFEEDKGKEFKDRVFPEAICEYYDFSNDLLIKFYSLNGYDIYCADEEADNNKPE